MNKYNSVITIIGIAQFKNQGEPIQIYEKDKTNHWKWSGIISKDNITNMVFEKIQLYLDLPVNQERIWRNEEQNINNTIIV